MKKSIQSRILNEADLMLKTNKTIREIAKNSNVSKSTVHKDLSERLFKVDETIANNISDIMKDHLNTRHIRGGEATKNKYQKK